MTMPVAPSNSNSGWGGFGGDGWWIILFVIILFGWGGNGWGGNNSDGVNNGLCDGFYAMNTGMLNGFANVTQAVTSGFQTAELSKCNQQAALMAQLNAMQMQAQECCCENRAAIAQVRYDMATQACDTRNTIQNTTRDIIDNANSNSKAILDFLVNSKMQDLQTENQNLKLAASQAAQNNYLVSQLRPCPTPAYITCNPWAASAPYGTCGSCA